MLRPEMTKLKLGAIFPFAASWVHTNVEINVGICM